MKKMMYLLIAALIIGLIYFSSMLVLIINGTKDLPLQQPDTILILGAQVNGSSKETAYPSTTLKERLDTAIPFIQQNPQAKIIVCGGQGADEPDSEANVMAAYLIRNTIAESRIIREDLSTRTKENIANAQKKADLGKTVIVTSDYHIYRSKLLAQRLGIKQVSGLPAESKSSITLKMYIREIAALSYGMLFDWSS